MVTVVDAIGRACPAIEPDKPKIRGKEQLVLSRLVHMRKVHATRYCPALHNVRLTHDFVTQREPVVIDSDSGWLKYAED